MADRQSRRWTPAEDQVLREQVDAQQLQGIGRDWCQVALTLPGRTNKDCRKRWHNSVAEGLRKGQWSKSEDQLLTRGVHRFGSQWTKVATCVNTRSADQCAKRWQQSLDPRLDRSEWREDEDAALIAAVERLGRHWKDIQEQNLPHRSKNCVKNRYSVLSRRNTTQLVPYDDSIEGSSSDPGTPHQLEINPSFAYTPLYNTPQTSHNYTQHSYPGNDCMSPAWSALSNSDSFLGASYSQHAGANAMPTHSPVHPNQVILSNANGGDYIQPTMGMQSFMQYSVSPSTTYQTEQYASHQPPSISISGSYVTSSAQAPNFYASMAGSSKRGSRYHGTQQDTAHFDWSPRQ
ncbi:hypothetical protein E8E11_011601 [Didymella keratinophila]|nr:hypothetical protein E8E11_011601 [Didymella keratinophila]